MSHKKYQVAFVLFLAFAGFFGSVHLGIQYSIHWLLVKEASSTGMDWAHLIKARLPNLPSMQNADHSISIEHVPDATHFSELVSDVLAIGNIYQIDYINSECYCELSLGSYRQVPAINQPVAVFTFANDHNLSDGHDTILDQKNYLTTL